MTMFTTLRTALAKRAAYNRLRHELASMPRDVALDLGMFPEDAEKVAAKAIYGQ